MQPAISSPLDAGILDRIRKRADTLITTSATTYRQITRTDQELRRVREEMAAELAQLSADVTALRTETEGTVARITGTIGHFRTSVKTQQLRRLQDRADVWGPEKLVTRDDLRALLDDAALR